MKNSLKILIFVLVVIVILILLLLGVKYLKPNEQVDNEIQTNSTVYDANDSVSTINAVVVKSNDSDLIAIRVDNPDSLVTINFPDNVTKDNFKEDQQITVYYDGTILESYPERIPNVSRIEVVKDKGDVDIPMSAYRYAYSSRANVEVSVDELTKSSVSFTIKDNNEYKYEYNNTYKVLKDKREIDQTEVPNAPIVTGNTTSSYDGTGIPLWEEVSKVSNNDSENSGTVENIDDNTIKITADWSGIYSELGEGNYKFSLDTSEAFSVIIFFTVDANGEVSDIHTSLS